jgi:hypothetical protein
MTPQEYTSLALRTASGDHQAILGRFGKDHTDQFVHAALGMSSEVTELLEMFHASGLSQWTEEIRQDAVAELGDCCWFFNLACSLGYVHFGNLPVEISLPINPKETDRLFERGLLKMSLRAGRLCDMAKAHLFYGKELKRYMVSAALHGYYTGILCCCAALGVSVESVFDKNIAKLKVRYNGAFSEKQALNRDLNAEKLAYSK